MAHDADVVVVGAGPAGASTAHYIALTGLDVLVLDKATFPRDKICGDGHTNFGQAYCIAGDIISAKCHVPHMYRFELLGTPQDAERVREGLEKFWQQPR